MKYLCSLAAMMLLAIAANAQSNYKAGYFISPGGDTTKGYINYREWSENPDVIDFKPTLNDNQRRQLTPQNARLVNIIGMDVYESYTGPISTDVEGSTERDTSVEQRTSFLKLLTHGDIAAIYDYRDRLKMRYFIKPGQAAPVELIFRTYKQNDLNVDERTYRKQLSIIASQNQKLDDGLNKLIQQTNYNEQDLVKVVKSINNITDNQAMAASAQKAKTLVFYAGVGANLSFYKTDGGLKFAGAPNASSVLPKIVAGFNVYANPRVQQLVLRVEAGAALGRYSTTYTSTVSPYNDAIFKFNQLNISVSPQILYNFYNKPDFKFFMGAGLQASLISYSGKEFRNADGSPSQLATQPFNSFLKSANSIIVKAGVVINRQIEINAGYQSVADVSHDPYFRITTTGAHLGVNYFLK
ncbi:hypothetical protein ABIB62_004317 [Mucilaginibacter sp. UYP25]|uniref:hypothetical protein n=1 Tax=unclassified Mucilaginibacter TaxID=2617802 RepID=UPI00339B8AD8